MPQLEANTELKNNNMKDLEKNSEGLKNAFAAVGIAFFVLVVYLYVFDIKIGGE